MCEILVRLEDTHHPDPVMAVQGVFLRGDPIAVAEDGAAWGIMESKAAWLAAGNLEQDWPAIHGIIKIPGMPAAKVRAMLESYMLGTRGTTGRMRAWGIHLDEMPTVLAKLRTTGSYTIKTPARLNRLRAAARHKITNNAMTALR